MKLLLTVYHMDSYQSLMYEFYADGQSMVLLYIKKIL